MAARANSFDAGEVERITIIGRHMEVTPAMQSYITEKLHKVEAHTPHVIEVIVYLEAQKVDRKVEILYKFSHFKVVAHATMDDMYQAFDVALGRLKGKLRKWKTKIQHHHTSKPSEIEMKIDVLDQGSHDLYEINDEIEEIALQNIEKELAPPKVIKKKKRSVPMLTLLEASMHLDFSGDNFLVYKSEEDQKLKVMYLRRDHSFGVLDIQ